MRIVIYISLVLSLLTSCKSNKQSQLFDYQSEKGLVEYYNIQKKSKPLVIVIPAVYNSLIGKAEIEKLAKKNRVAVLYFIAHDNKTRVQQIDGLANRQNYYSSVLGHVLSEEEKAPTIIAEGINATIALQLGLNFNQPKLVLINAWYKNMRDILTVNCYANQDNSCDSLLNYLSFSGRFVADNLFNALKENGIDKQYGNFTLQIWKDFMNLNCNDYLINYTNDIHWVYTTNSGLITQEEHKKTINSKGKRKNTTVVSKKEFYKKSSLLSN